MVDGLGNEIKGKQTVPKTFFGKYTLGFSKKLCGLACMENRKKYRSEGHPLEDVLFCVRLRTKWMLA